MKHDVCVLFLAALPMTSAKTKDLNASNELAYYQIASWLCGAYQMAKIEC